MKFWKNKLTWQWVTIYKVGDTLMNLVPFLLFCSFLVNVIKTERNWWRNREDYVFYMEQGNFVLKGDKGNEEASHSDATTAKQNYKEILDDLYRQEHKTLTFSPYKYLVGRLDSLHDHPILYQKAAHKVFSALFFEHFRADETKGTLEFTNDGDQMDLCKAYIFFKHFLESDLIEPTAQEITIARLAKYYIKKYIDERRIKKNNEKNDISFLYTNKAKQDFIELV